MTTWRRTLAVGLFSSICFAVTLDGRTGASAPAGLAAAGVTLTGSVVDAALAPLGHVTLTIERDGHVVASVTTSADGTFVVKDLSPGDYQIRAELSGHPSLTRGLHVPSGARAITLPLVLEATADESALVDRIAPKSAAGGTAAPLPIARGAGGGGRGGGSVAQPESRRSTIVGMPPSMMSPTYDSIGGWDEDQWWPSVPGESYAPIEANGFVQTRLHPLSTFGADVDTASYSNVRRFLASGQLPPPDAVRIEELVNYFHVSYPEPRDGQPIGLTTEIGDCPWAPSHKLVLIGARAVAPPAREITGRNLVLLIDVSGSMQPAERLPLIKTALGLFVDTLRPDDTISIVTYAGTSGVALYPTPARRRDLIQSAIAGLSAGGSTNGGAGLITAYRIARQAFVPGGVNRVILATDGDFNVGITGQNDLLHLIERERESGVFLSVFGVGTGNLKDRTMELLADHGNGHYAYLDSLQEARRVLIRESDATLETVAKDVKFQVEFNPSIVANWKLLGYEKREMAARDFNNDQKDGGEVGAGHTVTVLYEVIPVGAERADEPFARPDVDPLRYQPSPAPAATSSRPDATHQGEWLTVKARYKLPDEDTSQEIARVARAGGSIRALPFAAAIAEFGLLLRDNPHDPARWSDLSRRLEAIEVPLAQAADLSAFKDLVATAAGLSRIR